MIRFAGLFAALVLSACGGAVAPGAGGGNDPGDAPPADVAPDAVEADCADQVEGLLSALEELDGRLNVGLNFQDYSERVGDASVAYERIDVDELGPNCVERVGAPLESAMNSYITAYNTWNDCIGDTDCDTDSITPDLQSEWAEATELIEEAREAVDE